MKEWQSRTWTKNPWVPAPGPLSLLRRSSSRREKKKHEWMSEIVVEHRVCKSGGSLLHQPIKISAGRPRLVSTHSFIEDGSVCLASKQKCENVRQQWSGITGLVGSWLTWILSSISLFLCLQRRAEMHLDTVESNALVFLHWLHVWV